MNRIAQEARSRQAVVKLAMKKGKSFAAKKYGVSLSSVKRWCKCSHQVLTKTIQLRDFKAAGAQGIQQCKIRSIILPLLADHVLREANHYIRLLGNF